MTAKTKPGALRLSLAALAIAASLAAAAAPRAGAAPRPQDARRFEAGERDFLLDGRPFQIRCGELHAARVPREYWGHRLRMIRAMGLNTVCAYLFWNMHEPRPGVFDWGGGADIAEFCRLAQRHGLLVILRPGPYACAEWEMGGLPWWLLRDPRMRLRTLHPGFMEPARRYLREVGRVLAPLQITRGGPIIMVQVENEYGFFGKDAGYMAAMRQAVLDAGFDVPLFACNPPQHLRDGLVPELFQVVNFGSEPARGFAALREIQPKGPLMCGEFYPGWFDTWGAPHHLGDTEKYLADLGYMLEAGASFSIYMAHGGSSFGLWSGADRPFKPDTSSYDYDAPINEAGAPTGKFFRTRELMRAHLMPGEDIPEPPAPNPVQTFAPVAAAQTAPLFKNLPAPAPAAADAAAPLNMEALDQPHGCVLYRATLPAGPAAVLAARAVSDFGFVFLDGRRAGVMDRRLAHYTVALPARDRETVLDILVEAAGRINFGQEMHDRKGLAGPVLLTAKTAAGENETREITGWRMFPLPLDAAQLAALRYEPAAGAAAAAAAAGATDDAGDAAAAPRDTPAFWRATVTLAGSADTWLDMRDWGKGVVWINGRCLGRYWNIGPTQTMYVPGPWLRRGENEIIILDLLGPTGPSGGPASLSGGQASGPAGPAGGPSGGLAGPSVAGLAAPVLDQLRPGLDFARDLRRRHAPALAGAAPAWSGALPPGAGPCEIRFDAPQKGRHFGIETLDAHDGGARAAIAEISLLGPRGETLSIDGWTVVYADSEEHSAEDGSADNALDGQTATHWLTRAAPGGGGAAGTGTAAPAHPHLLIIDLGKKRTLTGFRLVPRQGGAAAVGRIKNCRIFVGDNLVVPEN
ncbi:MAG: beta-galactosidase [Opitutaceae bacterium]|jgi:beta-galactosidase|nr:beta-galactosidase [Opitutaceae bacterium]